VLTLDAAIQQYAEEALDDLQEKHAPQWSTCVVMNPDTGAVVAMANRPTFDPRRVGDSPTDYQANRAISFPIEPGSVFKPFIAIRALEEGEVRLGELFFCHNGLFVHRSRRLRDHHPYGNLSFEEIVYRSSNIGIVLIGLRLGKERVFDSQVRFGFGSRTGIDLPCEDAGMITLLRPDPRRPHATVWNDIYTITSVPMGHEVAATPLQLVTAFAAMANGGRLMRPYLVQRMIDPATGQVSFEAAPQMSRRVAPEATVSVFRKKVLGEVVENDRGTGKPARCAEYRLFGKTGTAQLAVTGGGRGYVPNQYIASFLCGGPLDEPRLVCLVTAYVPSKGQYYGGSVAAPYAGQVLRRALAYLGVKPDKPAGGPT
jgi:cell division protein FtsI/penicillin-binding protein 2